MDGSFSCLPLLCPKGSTPSFTFTYSSNAYFLELYTYLQCRNSVNNKKNAAFCVLCLKYLYQNRTAGKHISHPYIIYSLMLYHKVRISLSSQTINHLIPVVFFFSPGTRSFSISMGDNRLLPTPPQHTHTHTFCAILPGGIQTQSELVMGLAVPPQPAA